MEDTKKPLDGGIEREIRELGDYVEKQMKDLLDPQARPAATALRVAFRAVVGKQQLDRLMWVDELFNKERSGWIGDLKAIVAYAESHGSDAAEKIKKALPVAEQLTAEFKEKDVRGILPKVRYAKNKGLQF